MWSRASSANRHRRRRTWLRLVALAAFASLLLGTLLVATDTFGAGDRFERLLARVDRFISGPPPDRPGVVHGPHHPAAHRRADAQPDPDADRVARSRRDARPRRPSRPRLRHRRRAGADRLRHRHRPRGGLRPRAQGHLVRPGRRPDGPGHPRARRHLGCLPARAPEPGQREWESYDDSHNGAVGPVGDGPRARGLRREGLRGPRATRRARAPLRDAAKAIQETKLAGHPARLARRAHLGHDRLPGRRRPVGLPIAKISRRLHPGPVVSVTSRASGASPIRPGTFQDNAEMVRNFLPWKRPEGRYPDRDGLYIAVVPTLTVAGGLTPIRRTRGARKIASRTSFDDHPGRVAERDREDARPPARGASWRRRSRRRARRTRR